MFGLVENFDTLDGVFLGLLLVLALLVWVLWLRVTGIEDYMADQEERRLTEEPDYIHTEVDPRFRTLGD